MEVETAPILEDFKTDLDGKPFHYLANPKLKNKGVVLGYSPDHIEELIKCKNDIYYFANNYFKIVHQDLGEINMPVRDYQKGMIKNFQDNRFSITIAPRQTGKTTALSLYILHYILFNEHKNVAILANKEKQAKEILARVKQAYQQLPFWLQQGVETWNKTEIQLENGCKINVAATSAEAITGQSVSLLVIDEVAKIDGNIWDDFWSSSYPTISAAKTSKVLMVSTPKGMNHFYKLWIQAMDKASDFVPLRTYWQEVEQYAGKFKRYVGDRTMIVRDALEKVDFEISYEDMFLLLRDEPKRNRYYRKTGKKKLTPIPEMMQHKDDGTYDIIDDDWRDQTIRNVGKRKFGQEYDCEFLAASNSLVEGSVVETMKIRERLNIDNLSIYDEVMDYNPGVLDQINIYFEPEPNHEYHLGLDCATITEESDGDSMSCQIIDVTEMPFKQVATLMIRNEMHYLDAPELIAILGEYYNEAMVFIENNDRVGISIADNMVYTIGYDNIYSEKPNIFGYNTTKKNKKAGCLTLKAMAEQYKIQICDIDTITQISTFVKNKTSYAGDKGYHDDAVMSLLGTLVFMNDQDLFEDLIKMVMGDISNRAKKRQKPAVEPEPDDELLPMGISPWDSHHEKVF